MRKTRVSMMVLAAGMALFTTLAVAGPRSGWRGSGGWGMGGGYQGMYNLATVETLSGEVVAVDKITPVRGMDYGIQLQVKTGTETIPVSLGPGWFIERLDTKIVKGDPVEVKGSRVTLLGKPAMIAAAPVRMPKRRNP